jgi:hypothetical protein
VIYWIQKVLSKTGRTFVICPYMYVVKNSIKDEQKGQTLWQRNRVKKKIAKKSNKEKEVK